MYAIRSYYGLIYNNKISNAKKISRDLPVFFLSGIEDPVGNYGKGVKQAGEFYRKAGLRNMDCKIYAGARHEILNETNKDEVYKDIYDWIVKQTANE